MSAGRGAGLKKPELTATEVKKGIDLVLTTPRAEPWTAEDRGMGVPGDRGLEVLRRSG